MKEMETFRQRMTELNPQKVRQLEQQKELEPMLWEYQQQINQAAAQAAAQARQALQQKDSQYDDPVRLSQLMQQAATQAKEIAQAQIIEEIQLLFDPKTTG